VIFDPVGLFHSLQHAGLTRRSLINAVSEKLVPVQRWDGYNAEQYEGRNRSLSNVTEQ
jgi:hypothetical protein